MYKLAENVLYNVHKISWPNTNTFLVAGLAQDIELISHLFMKAQYF